MTRRTALACALSSFALDGNAGVAERSSQF